MARNLRSPLSGAPRTVQSVDAAGHPRFEITPAEFTPQRAKAVDALKRLIALIVLLLVIALVVYHPRRDALDIAEMIGLGAGCYLLTTFLVELSLLNGSTIVMTTGAISVRRWYGWQRFDRNIEHHVALLYHDRADEERRRIDLETRKAAQKGEVIQPPIYYGDSFHVVLVYAGHRADLLTVYGQAAAQAVASRIQYCDRCLNEALNMGGGINAEPGDEWNDAPGGIDHV